MNVGLLRHFVTLMDNRDDGTPEIYVPDQVWAAVAPASPGAFDEERITHTVTMRYHPQISFNTKIIHRERHFYVKGMQNIDERNEELVLLCEEVRAS